MNSKSIKMNGGLCFSEIVKRNRKIADYSHLPYFTISPTVYICPLPECIAENKQVRIEVNDPFIHS